MSSRALRRVTEAVDTIDVDPDEADSSNRDFEQRATSFTHFNHLLTADTPECCQPNDIDEEVPIKTGRNRKKKGKKKPQINHTTNNEVSLPDEFPITDLNESTKVRAANVADLLVVNVKQLDPMAELSRLFGLSTVRDSQGHEGQTLQPQHQFHVKRGTLVRVKRVWPPVVRFGLDMERLPDGSYTFTHNRQYQNVQKMFYQALDSMDPNNITNILAEYPYHVDSLLQLSDVFMHQENSELGADLLERTLHAYQSALHPCFNPVIGTCRLSYRYQQNRGLFVALFRYIAYVGSRGCYRNALDYCKILFSLDVDGDPLGTLLMIDCYALLSRQLEFLIEFYDRLNPTRNLYLLPNFAFSLALAFKLTGKTKSHGKRDMDSLLQDALIMFPGFVTRMLKHCSIGGITNLDKSNLFGREVINEPESLGRLLDLYVARMHHLWTDPRVLSWLEQNVECLLLQLEPHGFDSEVSNAKPDPRVSDYSHRRKTLYRALPQNVIRHLVLADIAEAPPILPRDSPHLYSFDPLPPSDSIDIYNPEEERRRFREAHTRDGGLLSTFLASLLPNYAIQRALYDAGAVGPEPEADAAIPARQTLTSAVENLVAAVRRVFEAQVPEPPADNQPENQNQ